MKKVILVSCALAVCIACGARSLWAAADQASKTAAAEQKTQTAPAEAKTKAAATDEKTKAAAAEPKPKPMELADADNGKSIKVAVGTPVVIRLEGNPTTGYSWRAAKIAGDAVQDSGEPEYKQKENTRGLAGSGGTFTFTMKTIKQGKAEIQLEYVRPWEKDIAPIKTYKLSVEVTEK
jgi:inhibitor of cysteine peptidase